MPGLKDHSEQIEDKIANELPLLNDHFEKIGLPLSLLTMDWIVGLFMNYVPLEHTGSYLDIFFQQGPWKVIHKAAIEVLRC